MIVELPLVYRSLSSGGLSPKINQNTIHVQVLQVFESSIQYLRRIFQPPPAGVKAWAFFSAPHQPRLLNTVKTSYNFHDLCQLRHISSIAIPFLAKALEDPS